MRSFLTYGLISLVGAAALYACGDDSGDGTTSTGGSPGVGGSAGAGGSTAGTTGMSGAGGGGAGGSAGGGAVVIPTANCQGCVQLTVPIPATPVNTQFMHSQATYAFSAPMTGPPFDLTNVTTITWRVQSLTPNANYYVQPFLQNRPPEDSSYKGDYGEPVVLLSAATFAPNAWVDVVLNVAAQPGPGGVGGPDAGADAGAVADAGDAGGGAPAGTLAAFDKSKTRYIGLYVGANAAAGAGLVSVEIDSVTVVGTSTFTTQTFDASAGGLTIDTGFESPPGAVAPAFH